MNREPLLVFPGQFSKKLVLPYRMLTLFLHAVSSPCNAAGGPATETEDCGRVPGS